MKRGVQRFVIVASLRGMFGKREDPILREERAGGGVHPAVTGRFEKSYLGGKGLVPS